MRRRPLPISKRRDLISRHPPLLGMASHKKIFRRQRVDVIGPSARFCLHRLIFLCPFSFSGGFTDYRGSQKGSLAAPKIFVAGCIKKVLRWLFSADSRFNTSPLFFCPVNLKTNTPRCF